MGNTAIAYGTTEQAIGAAKVFTDKDVKKAGKVSIKGGLLEGEALDANSAQALADVPDRDTLNAQLLNFSRSSVKQDPDYDDRWILETTEAEAYPEVLCWTTQGFNNRMAQEHGCPELWCWERPQPDVILFRMQYAV